MTWMTRWQSLTTVLVLLCTSLVGCDSDIDSDTLVRELRILSLRIGSTEPFSVADAQADVRPGPGGLDLVFTTDHLDLNAFVAAPTGPGRRIAAPRPLVYEWFLCVGPASLFNQGTLDPGCRKWLPGDPDPMKSSSLRYLGSGQTFAMPTAALKDVVGGVLQLLLSGGPGGGGTVKLPETPVSLLLPLILRVRVDGGDPNDIRDREVGVTYLRTWVALPGMTLPAPNLNPALGELLAGPDKEGNKTALIPCTAMSCPKNKVKRGADLFLIGGSVAGSAQTYVRADDTEQKMRTETMRYSWFATDGEFDRERTGDTQPDNFWNSEPKRPAPAEANSATLWLVGQEERGGADARAYELEFTN